MENNQVSKLSVGGWLGTIIVLGIPIVGFIMLFVWAFGGDNTGRKNYCIAVLILMAIAIVITIIVYAILGAAMFTIFNSMR